jgi:hypothetical protein
MASSNFTQSWRVKAILTWLTFQCTALMKTFSSFFKFTFHFHELDFHSLLNFGVLPIRNRNGLGQSSGSRMIQHWAEMVGREHHIHQSRMYAQQSGSTMTSTGKVSFSEIETFFWEARRYQ